jgi:UDP-N-acetylglucosamine--N-acetylmuramyl-(pentapeptide) pyrophosphoryl-undecaprenol N-acetylglucosamine transferase
MRTVLVASGGGHLQQLYSFLPRLGLDSDDVIWATPDSGLAQHLLRDEERVILPYTRPRDWRGALRLTGSALQLLRRTGAERIISTGASPAPPFFLAGETLGLEMHYIESATRSEGPSLSGKLVSMLPSAFLYTQYPEWAGGRWRFAGSIFDPYKREDAIRDTKGLQRVVVTLGTEAYGFRRAVERLLEVLPEHADVLWQTGYTDVSGLGIDARQSVPGDELRNAMAEADVVVSHAGTGSALTSFDMGKVPLILPRESKFAEHVDNHQTLTAKELSRRGLAIAVPVGELAPRHLEMTLGTRVVKDTFIRPFDLLSEMQYERSATLDDRDPGRADAPSRGSAKLSRQPLHVDFPRPRRHRPTGAGSQAAPHAPDGIDLPAGSDSGV